MLFPGGKKQIEYRHAIVGIDQTRSATDSATPGNSARLLLNRKSPLESFQFGKGVFHLRHRAAAPFSAISLRRCGLSFFLRSKASATAPGFFFFFAGFGILPKDSSTRNACASIFFLTMLAQAL